MDLARHGAWFAARVIQVKLEYGMTVDPRNACSNDLNMQFFDFRDQLNAHLKRGHAINNVSLVNRSSWESFDTSW